MKKLYSTHIMMAILVILASIFFAMGVRDALEAAKSSELVYAPPEMKWATRENIIEATRGK